MNNSDMPAMPLPDYTMQETVQIDGADEGVTTVQYVTALGLTKREHFAAMAMQAIIIGNNADICAVGTEGASLDAIRCADALLAALEDN